MILEGQSTCSDRTIYHFQITEAENRGWPEERGD